MKVCISCRIEKVEQAFGIDARAKDGKFRRCLACQAVYRERHREQLKLIDREFYQRNRGELRAKQAASYKKNPFLKRKQSREWNLQNPDRAASRIAKWRDENRPAMRAHRAARRGRERGAIGVHSGNDVENILKLQRNKCASCATSLRRGYHVDHVVSISAGGTNWPSNLQCLCKTCNLRKAAKDPIVWAQENGRLI